MGNFIFKINNAIDSVLPYYRREYFLSKKEESNISKIEMINLLPREEDKISKIT